MWSVDTLKAAESLCRELHNRFLDRLDDDEQALFHVLERLQVATGMANGSVRWGRVDTPANIEQMLHGAINQAMKMLGSSVAVER